MTSINNLYKVEAEEFDNAVKLKVWNKVAISNFISYEEAKKIIRKLKIKSKSQFDKIKKENKLPKNFPRKPDYFYRNSGFISWSEFTGSNYIATFKRQYMDFKKAKKFLKPLGFKSSTDYKKYCKSKSYNKLLPMNPPGHYKLKGWKGWGNFLGTNMPQTQKRKFLIYSKAKKFVHKLKIQNANPGWRNYLKIKTRWDIPSQPDIYYKNNGWKNWEDFLGPSYVRPGEKQKGNYLNYIKAKLYIKKFNINSANEWKIFSKSRKRPKFIPSHPQIILLQE